MRLIPRPKDIQLAAEYAVDRVIGERFADVTPLPATTIVDVPQCHVTRYEGGRRSGEPVLLIPPLAAPAFVYDMRRGCSLAEFLLDHGRRVYLVDYGQITFAERHLGLENWIDDIIPHAVRAASEDSGGKAVHLVAWSLGGTMTALMVAKHHELPVASVTMVGSPLDSHQVPLIALFSPFVELTGGVFGTTLYRALGMAPGAIVKRIFQVATFDRYVAKPFMIMQNLGDPEYLAQIEAVDRVVDGMAAYPGRALGQIYHDILRLNELAEGRIEFHDEVIDLRAIDRPLLAIAGEHDGIAPVGAVHHIRKFVRNAQLETAPGGHLGVLTGRNAATTTWPLLNDFISSAARKAARKARRRAAVT